MLAIQLEPLADSSYHLGKVEILEYATLLCIAFFNTIALVQLTRLSYTVLQWTSHGTYTVYANICACFKAECIAWDPVQYTSVRVYVRMAVCDTFQNPGHQ